MIHHLAIATKNIVKAHHFYTEVMGFALVKAVKRQAPGGGWTKHVFYDMGDGMLFALWDLRGMSEQIDPASWNAGLSTGLGLPGWINHVAFEAEDEEDLQRRRQRWLNNGYHVTDVDHDFIRSCYTFDPDGTMVEWTYRTRALDQGDVDEAFTLMRDDTPADEPDYEMEVTKSTVKKRFPEQV